MSFNILRCHYTYYGQFIILGYEFLPEGLKCYVFSVFDCKHFL